MSLRRSLLAASILAVVLPTYMVASRLGLLSYAVQPSKLPRNTFARLNGVGFIRCSNCQRDGQLVVGGKIMARVVTHERAVQLLADWAHTFSGAQYAALYNQVALATWFPDFTPMLPIPRLDPTFAQVDLAVKAHLMLLEAIRRGVQVKAVYA